MPVYKFKAIDPSGKNIADYIEAPNLDNAQAKLKQKQYYITSLNEDSSKRDRELSPMLSALLYRVSSKDKSLFSKQLATLLGAGVTLNVALTDVWEQTDNRTLRVIVGQLKEDVVSGKSLSEAIADHQDIFPPVYENMIKVGEATGSYEKTLNRLAELEEKNAELQSKAITALIYPFIMLVISIAVVIFVLTGVVPQIESLFTQFGGVELPLPTRIVLALSSFVRNYWYTFILFIIAIIGGFQKWQQAKSAQIQWDKIKFKIPLMGKLQKRIIVSRFARNLGILLESRVPLLTALEIIAGIVNTELFKDEIHLAIKQIKEGSSLRIALQNSIFLPHMAKGMMAAGEAADKMAEVLLKVADIMEVEVDAAVKRLTTALEPIMIVVMGFIVGGIIVSVILPLYKMTELIK